MSEENNNPIAPVTGGAPAWVQAMRDAAQKVVTADVVEQIVLGQVEAAKKGDRKAIDFIFNQVLGGGQVKASTIIQNNYHGDAARPRAAASAAAAAADPEASPAWKCVGCGGRFLRPDMPEKCGKCGGTRFTAIIRKVG